MDYFCKCVVKSVKRTNENVLTAKLTPVQGWELKLDNGEIKSIFVNADSNQANLIDYMKEFKLDPIFETLLLIAYEKQTPVKVTIDEQVVDENIRNITELELL